MMGLSEWITVVSVVGTIGAIILAAVIYLVHKLMTQSAATAVAEEKAKSNAIAIEKITKADDIVSEQRNIQRTIDRLRRGDF